MDEVEVLERSRTTEDLAIRALDINRPGVGRV